MVWAIYNIYRISIQYREGLELPRQVLKAPQNTLTRSILRGQARVKDSESYLRTKRDYGGSHTCERGIQEILWLSVSNG